MSLTFFAEKPYFDSKKGRFMRASSLIRGEQIAQYLGAKYNPAGGYESDVCVYVKPVMNKDGSPAGKFEGKAYIDVIDHIEYIRWLRAEPKLSGIASSLYAYDYIRKYAMPNKIVFIPQQHCNFENFVRNRKAITTVGIIGTPGAFKFPIDEAKKRLEAIGLVLQTCFNYQTREDIVNFYKDIDIQIIWETKYRLLKNPLKIINAASFGIPTVGYPMKCYKEIDGYYIKALTIDQLVEEVERLKDQTEYDKASRDLVKMAQKYHISIIAGMYRKLD